MVLCTMLARPLSWYGSPIYLTSDKGQIAHNTVVLFLTYVVQQAGCLAGNRG